MVEKKVTRKVRGLLAGLELIMFDKAKPEQAISEVSSYVSRLRLSLHAQLEKKEQEEILKMVAIIAFAIFSVILLYFAFRKK